jgi:transketolase
VLLSAAWSAADLVARHGIEAAVVNMPWLNRIDEAWLESELGRAKLVVTLDNHYVTLGQGVQLAAAAQRRGIVAAWVTLGLESIPACGANAEVLAHHGLDAASIARTIASRVQVPDTTLSR